MQHASTFPFDLPAITRATFVRHVEFHPVLASTNTTAVELLEPLLNSSPAVVLTSQQTAGRGRKGNAWWSTAGALTFSLVLDPAQLQLSAELRPLLSLAAGLAVRDVMSQLLPERDVVIKWPNDVLVGRHKICGILAEQQSTGDRQGLIIGIGVNVNNSLAGAPPEIRQRATSLFDLQQYSCDLTDVLLRVLQQLERRIQQLPQQRMVLLAEANHCHLLAGRHVSVQVAEQTVSGHCLGIDDHGQLVLRDGSQIQRLPSGVVLHWSESAQTLRL